jgi:hypothetical protein
MISENIPKPVSFNTFSKSLWEGVLLSERTKKEIVRPFFRKGGTHVLSAQKRLQIGGHFDFTSNDQCLRFGNRTNRHGYRSCTYG